MKYCAACGTALDDAAVFCSSCGAQQAPVAPVAPVVEAPVVEAPVAEVAPAPEYVQPVAPAPVVEAPAYSVAYPAYQPTVAPVKEGPSVKSKILAGVGMGLAIFGFLYAIIMFFMSIGAADSYDEDLAVGVIMMFIMMMPFSILGLSFCGPARKDGVGGIAVTGKVFSIIGIVLYGLSFFISLAAF